MFHITLQSTNIPMYTSMFKHLTVSAYKFEVKLWKYFMTLEVFEPII